MKDSQNQKTKKRFFKRKKIKTEKLKEPSVLASAKKPKRIYNSASFFKKYQDGMFLLIIPLTLFVIFLIVYFLNSEISLDIQKNKLTSSNNTNLASYPVVQNIYEPVLSAKAAIVIDGSSQTVLFSKNPHLRFSTASTVKIMTALVALDYYQPDSILTIKSFGTEGSGLNLQAEDRFYFNDLLYAMLLPSANDAAAAIADNYPGGQAEFVLKMNQKAKDQHLTDTHFSDPIGLDDDGDYSTVVDIGRLGSVAIKNKQFAKVVGTQQKLISNIYSTREYNLINLNKLLGISGVNGIKTGTTEAAGEVLVTSTVQNGHTYIIVVMNSQDRFFDTGQLLEFIKQNVRHVVPSMPVGNL